MPGGKHTTGRAHRGRDSDLHRGHSSTAPQSSSGIAHHNLTRSSGHRVVHGQAAAIESLKRTGQSKGGQQMQSNMSANAKAVQPVRPGGRIILHRGTKHSARRGSRGSRSQSSGRPSTRASSSRERSRSSSVRSRARARTRARSVSSSRGRIKTATRAPSIPKRLLRDTAASGARVLSTLLGEPAERRDASSSRGGSSKKPRRRVSSRSRSGSAARSTRGASLTVADVARRAARGIAREFPRVHGSASRSGSRSVSRGAPKVAAVKKGGAPPRRRSRIGLRKRRTGVKLRRRRRARRASRLSGQGERGGGIEESKGNDDEASSDSSSSDSGDSLSSHDDNTHATGPHVLDVSDATGSFAIA